jgi:hypothetical protein
MFKFKLEKLCVIHTKVVSSVFVPIEWGSTVHRGRSFLSHGGPSHHVSILSHSHPWLVFLGVPLWPRKPPYELPHLDFVGWYMQLINHESYLGPAASKHKPENRWYKILDIESLIKCTRCGPPKWWLTWLNQLGNLWFMDVSFVIHKLINIHNQQKVPIWLFQKKWFISW